MDPKQFQQTRYLMSIICLVSAALVATCYKLAGYAFSDFFSHAAPDAFIALIAIPVVYFLFERHGLNRSTSGRGASVEVIDERIKAWLTEIRSGPSVHPSIEQFFPCWREVDWKEELRAVKQLDIIVSYFSSWAADYMDSLVDIFSRKGSITIILSSPEDEASVREVQKLYPEY